MKTEPQPPPSDIPHSAIRTPHSPRSSCRLTGKIARLPKKVRDKINHLLQDGLPYAQIIRKLGPDGQHLTISNLSRWKDSGYQDWLLEQAFLARTRLAQDSAWDLSANFDATRVTHAALQLATLHIFTALRDLQPGSLDEQLGGNSIAFARLVNALAHAGRQTLAIQSRRDTSDALSGALASLHLPSLLNSEDDAEDEDEEDEEEDDENEEHDEAEDEAQQDDDHPSAPPLQPAPPPGPKVP
jgi:hypothetical protein